MENNFCTELRSALKRGVERGLLDKNILYFYILYHYNVLNTDIIIEKNIGRETSFIFCFLKIIGVGRFS